MSPIQMSLEDQLKEWKSWSDKQIAARDLLLRRAVEALRPMAHHPYIDSQDDSVRMGIVHLRNARVLLFDIEQALK